MGWREIAGHGWHVTLNLSFKKKAQLSGFHLCRHHTSHFIAINAYDLAVYKVVRIEACLACYILPQDADPDTFLALGWRFTTEHVRELYLTRTRKHGVAAQIMALLGSPGN